MTKDGSLSEIRFDDQVAIVTGAGGGLGRQHALLLASRGALVVVNDIGGAVDGTGTSDDPASIVAKEIADAGGIAVADTNSIATPEGGEAVVATALDAFGRVDILINNAGILRDRTFAKMDAEAWDAVMAVHLTGAVNVTVPAWRQMREQAYGRIVNTSSGSGLFGNFGQANYGAAKMGLVGLTNVLAQEGAACNIKVNAISPVAATRRTEKLFPDIAERLDPALVSPAVAYLASSNCQVTGETWSVFAGRVARVFVAVGAGYFDPELTPEKLQANLDAIRSEADYSVPVSVLDEIRAVLPRLVDR
jgi:NAD(P)-dependent dehydrogenase (short-subunit alcohol dehydrogenase family)